MVKLNFTVDENYLLAHTLYYEFARPYAGNEAVRMLQTKAKRPISRVPSKCLYFRAEDILGLPFEKLPIDIQHLSRELVPTKEFRNVLHETQDFKAEVESEWLSNYNDGSRLMKQITKLDIRNREFTVYITHPSLSNGRYAGKGRICWGTRPPQSWPGNGSYVTVYMYHEVYHGILSQNDAKVGIVENKKVPHALIELATDNELRVRMNGGAYPPLVGHSENDNAIRAIENWMLPHWKRYLLDDGEHILAFDERMRRRFLKEQSRMLQ
ncbi:hypothetical protein EPN87_04420 [archaeon]|nr:MAG: hypothetical protein EPN87_04420 [archaeon]